MTYVACHTWNCNPRNANADRHIFHLEETYSLSWLRRNKRALFPPLHMRSTTYHLRGAAVKLMRLAAPGRQQRGWWLGLMLDEEQILMLQPSRNGSEKSPFSHRQCK